MVYVSANIDGLYLSETALKELHIINSSFPEPVSVNESKSAASADVTQQEDTECRCARRASPPQRPTELPFAATADNVGHMKTWLISAFTSSAFNTCVHQPLQSMTGAPVNIKFKEDVMPYAVHAPIPIPHHWKQKVKEDIDRDVRLGILEPVPQGTHTVWCARMVVAPKKDGTPRRTVDLQELNKCTLRETHHTPSPFNLVSTVPVETVKTVLDAWNGYHSLELSEQAKDATTFITEWGRYRYCRAPMGFHTSGDAYTRRFDDITTAAGVLRSVRCIDDTLLWDKSIEDAFWHASKYLSLVCGEWDCIQQREVCICSSHSRICWI